MSDSLSTGAFAGWLIAATVLMPSLGVRAEETPLRDPTTPAGFEQQMLKGGGARGDDTVPLPPDPGAFKLTGLFINPEGNSALINGLRVWDGDEIAPEQRVKVLSDGVEISGPGGHIKLELISISVKNPTENAGGERK